MTYTTKNEIAIDFLAMEHKKGTFKSFSDNEIKLKKEIVLNDFLNEKLTKNDENILFHWHKKFLKILKIKLLDNLIKNE